MGAQIILPVPRARVDNGQKDFRIHHFAVERPPVLVDAVHVGQVLDAGHDFGGQAKGEEGADAGSFLGVCSWGWDGD